MWNIRALTAKALLLAFLGAALPASAGDGAHPLPLGFSEDGRIFAFAEWGAEDGSGFAYASVYLIDLAADKWAAKPVKIRHERDGASARLALVEALGKAEPALSGVGITQPARLVFARAPGLPEGATERHDITLQAYGLLAPQGRAYEAVLEPRVLAGGDCGDVGFGAGKAAGFALRWGGAAVHEDTKLPASRGCPTGYSLERIYMAEQAEGGYAAALIGVYRYGFEGPDLRHIALPLPLK